MLAAFQWVRAHLVDGRLGGAQQLGDLRVGHFRVVAQEPGDGVRAVLTTRHRGVARGLLLRLQQFGVTADLGLHAVGVVGLRLVELFAGQLAIADRIGAADVARHFAVGDAAHFQRVQITEVGDLLEAQRRIVHEPDGRRLGHQDVGHAVLQK
jgi:hypothetical protein